MICRTPLTLFAIVLFLAGYCSAFADSPAGQRMSPPLAGAACDDDGRLFQLRPDGGVSVALGAGVEMLVPVEPSIQPADVALHANGRLIVASTVFPGQGLTQHRGRLKVYDVNNGAELHEILLPPRWQPIRIGSVNDDVAVLANSPEEGFAVHLMDGTTFSLSESRIAVSFGCDEGLGLADMATTSTGMWVALLEQCDDSYLIRKYDLSGNVISELSRPIEPIPQRGRRVTPAIKGLFADSEYVGVLLNRAGAQGAPVDLWSVSGEFLERVEILGIQGHLLRAVPVAGATGFFDIVDLSTGDVTRIDLAQLQ